MISFFLYCEQTQTDSLTEEKLCGVAFLVLCNGKN